MTPPISLDPSKAASPQFQTPAYGSLLHAVGNGAVVVPSLAQSFKWIGDNNTELQVVLKPGLMFSDGTPLNSAAVKTSAQHFATNGSAASGGAKEIASMATPDAQTIIFTLKAPDPTFPNQLGDYPPTGLGMIVSPKAIAAHENLGTTTDGAGPYKISPTETIEGSTYTYIRNPNYPDKTAYRYDKIVLKVIADPNTELAALQSGQVQVAQGTADTTSRALAAHLGVAPFPSSIDALFLLDLGKLVPALGNVDVRQAMNFAIDRVAAAKVITLGTGHPTVQLAIPGTIGYDASLEGIYPFDVAKAKALMASAGYSHGFTLPVLVPGFEPSANEVAQILSAQLAKIGITVQLTTTSSLGAYVAASFTGKYAGTTFSLGFPTGIPSTYNVLFSPTALGNANHTDYPVVPAIQAANALAGSAASGAWHAINKTIVNQGIEVPVDVEAYPYFYSKTVSGVADSVTANPLYITPAK